jgi:hypothetical protein
MKNISKDYKYFEGDFEYFVATLKYFIVMELPVKTQQDDVTNK